MMKIFPASNYLYSGGEKALADPPQSIGVAYRFVRALRSGLTALLPLGVSRIAADHHGVALPEF
jgi:hypothetical protein